MNIKIGYLLFTFSMCLGFCNQLAAQERRTVLLNTDSINYTFENISKIPFVIGEDKAKLHLSLHTNKLEENQIQYLKLSKKNSEKSIGQGKIINGTTSLKIPLNIHDSLNQKDTLLELKGRFTTNYTDKNIILNNSIITSEYYTLKKQPSLVLDYEVTKEPYGTSWSQLDGNAQHTNQTDWTNDNYNFHFKYERKEIYKDPKKSIAYMSLYKNKPIIFGKDNNDKPFVAMLTGELGNKVLWQLPLDYLPTKQPIISSDGKMLFISEKKILEVLDLNEVKRIKSIPISDIKINLTKNESQPINGIADEMTIGYDGTLYMPTTNEGGKFGIVALTAYPSLKPRWFYNTTNPVGTVSLSENEKMAFFIETDTKSAKSRLIVLDNINGVLLTQSKDILSSYATIDGNSYFPSVVLQALDKDTSVVYVLDGHKTSNKLYVFKVNYDQFFDRLGLQKKVAELEHVKLIESKDSKNAGLSKPTVFNQEKVFFMKYDSLKTYNIRTNTEGNRATFKTSISNNSDVQLYCHKTNGANVYVFAPSRNRLYYTNIRKTASSEGYTETNVSLDENYTPSNLIQVIMLPNLSICALDNKETVHYYYLKPFLAHTIGTASIDNIKHKYAYLKEQIHIKPMTVTENIQSIIVGKEIRISSDFKVQKGASLTFQIRK